LVILPKASINSTLVAAGMTLVTLYDRARRIVARELTTLGNVPPAQ